MCNKSLIFLALIALGLVGCNSKEATNTDISANADQQKEAQAAPAQTAPAVEPDKK